MEIDENKLSEAFDNSFGDISGPPGLLQASEDDIVEYLTHKYKLLLQQRHLAKVNENQ